MLLLAAHRLRQLSPELASEGSIEGAVVGCLNWDGSVALRSVVAVKQLDTTRDGSIDREATLLRLWPGEPVPVPLSRLLSQSGLAAAAPMVWSAALTAFRQAEKLYHAGGGGSSSAVVGDYGGGAHLGDRASCVLVALRLAKLALLQQPLAELSALMQQALLQQLQDLEQTELAPQTQAWCNPPGWEGQLRNLEGAKQHQKQQEQQEDQQEGQQDEEQPDEEEQQQQQQQQDFGCAQHA
ncbi:hypothetical protein MNEG_0691 [Monoraphidium neglectum]|uniref:Uncharacterized protein n=1 Tax=Monoraphidium neglectum TaxID=145388 RepID=A0A0D2LLM1_9CHLO|nr:hypothetical protein MNEG_0691 [Monoraphidium neglectum]KIZ07259.1 hypothetical protein MNEG_0691 [Monoraphidium neglectum]|eukprot:XP_013906278.1 hypothetical protein MNEG_0691 [Monoraphidium neglectum]